MRSAAGKTTLKIYLDGRIDSTNSQQTIWFTFTEASHLSTRKAKTSLAFFRP